MRQSQRRQAPEMRCHVCGRAVFSVHHRMRTAPFASASGAKRQPGVAGRRSKTLGRVLFLLRLCPWLLGCLGAWVSGSPRCRVEVLLSAGPGSARRPFPFPLPPLRPWRPGRPKWPLLTPSWRTGAAPMAARCIPGVAAGLPRGASPPPPPPLAVGAPGRSKGTRSLISQRPRIAGGLGLWVFGQA